jgi:hypothetical protein
MSLTNAALLAAALLFVLFIVAQALLPALVRRSARARSAAFDAALGRSEEAARPAADRAAALREAATLAVDELRRPHLAVRLLLRAEELAPGHPGTIALVARAMTRARQLRALERWLWKALDAHVGAPGEGAALDALLALYEGPLGAPERARAIRRLRSDAAPRAPSAPG